MAKKLSNDDFIRRCKTIFGNNERFTLLDQGEYILNGVVIDVDEVSKKSREIFLIKIIGE